MKTQALILNLIAAIIWFINYDNQKDWWMLLICAMNLTVVFILAYQIDKKLR